MATLFDNLESEETTSLKIVPSGKKVLSKIQQDFNRLNEKIQTLELKKHHKEESLNRLLDYYSKTVAKIEKRNAELLVELCKALDEASKIHKFTNKTKEEIGDIICTLLNQAFNHIEETEDLDQLNKKWLSDFQKSMSEFEKGVINDFVSSMFESVFGSDLDLDFSNLDPKDPETIRKIKEKLEELESEKEAANAQKKKTKKQLEKEKLLKAEEELKSKNIRSVYISLSKVLHPDAEVDADLKLQKEEVMKQVTSAYENKDLSTLLRLELEWGLKSQKNLAELTEEKLKVYVQVLKGQCNELEFELRQLAHHPRFHPISEFSRKSEKTAMREMNFTVLEIEKMNNETGKKIEILSTLKNKKTIAEFITELINDIFDEDDEFFFDDDDW
jgi:hypothetical protein